MAVINKILLIMGMVMLIYVPANAQPDISGTYKCSGYDPTLSKPEFKESIKLKKTSENTYKVEVAEVNGVIPYFIGTAIVSKNLNNAFAFIFWDPNKPDKMGGEFVLINPDGSWDAVFANANKDVAGNETCRKI